MKVGEAEEKYSGVDKRDGEGEIEHLRGKELQGKRSMDGKIGSVGDQ